MWNIKELNKNFLKRKIFHIDSRILKKKMMPLPQQKKLVKNGYEMYGFTPEEKFYVISGIRTAAYKDEEKNGDCYSIGKIRE